MSTGLGVILDFGVTELTSMSRVGDQIYRSLLIFCPQRYSSPFHLSYLFTISKNKKILVF